MSDNHKLLQVFIASPNDLVEERKAISEVAESLNAAFGREGAVQVQLLGWKDRLAGHCSCGAVAAAVWGLPRPVQSDTSAEAPTGCTH